eukprot:CAMPEP_0206032672 /NCGR_PEP_ID=MMETSP1466-20131121/101_1 /ASSEMBLY_ACC=CAM_ASM_001126 /TAXON_ID=44452 /ORGANISM="Pavlova gyrans, Strain CCMP608" /LENGTH=194 /DNA_ID=CAMNT_0053406807 /DNA_START=186 /DNA_END=771 /DNA_ORIENTATION=+
MARAPWVTAWTVVQPRQVPTAAKHAAYEGDLGQVRVFEDRDWASEGEACRRRASRKHLPAATVGEGSRALHRLVLASRPAFAPLDAASDARTVLEPTSRTAHSRGFVRAMVVEHSQASAPHACAPGGRVVSLELFPSSTGVPTLRADCRAKCHAQPAVPESRRKLLLLTRDGPVVGTRLALLIPVLDPLGRAEG